MSLPTYRQTKKLVIKICLQCKIIDELQESTVTCPKCNSVNCLGFWETPEMFLRYLHINKPKGLYSNKEHLQYLIDEGLGNL